MNNATRTELSAFLDSTVRELRIPHSICACTENHALVYHHTAGIAGGEPGDDSVFHLYSATKTLTAAAAMQLVERSLLDLDAPVARYLPEYEAMYLRKGKSCVPAENPLTVAHLLSMQGGFDYILHTPEVDRLIAESGGSAGTREIVREWSKKKLRFEPGTHFMYSLCLDVFGGVLEAACGMTVGQWMKENIFEPLGMQSTTFAPDEGMVQRMMPLYRLLPDGTIAEENKRENFCRLTESFESCGGGLYGTLADLMRFADAMACGGTGANGARILSERSISLMNRNRLGPQSLIDYRNRYSRPGYGYGLGVRTSLGDGTAEPEGVFGWDGAAGAHVMIDPNRHTAMVFLMHVLDMEVLYDHVFNKMDAIIYR